MPAQSVGSMETRSSARNRDSILMRAVNLNLRSLSADLGPSDSIAFFCECRHPACFAVLWLTNPEFDAAVEAGETWIVTPAHQPSGRAQRPACQPRVLRHGLPRERKSAVS